MSIVIDLSSDQGNSFSIIGTCRRLLRKIGRSDMIDAYTLEATSGNRSNLLKVTEEYSCGIITFIHGNYSIVADCEYFDDNEF